MRKRFYQWLQTQFLPEWARRQLMQENKELRLRLERTEQNVLRLEAYIQGLQEGVRWSKRFPQYKSSMVENTKQHKAGDKM